jgi:hypothetical protein
VIAPSGMKNNRRSSIPRLSQNCQNVSNSGIDTNNSNNTQLAREVSELKGFNLRISERLASMDNLLRSLVVGQRDEVDEMRRVNRQLTIEVETLTENLRAQQQHISPADAGIGQEGCSVSLSAMGLSPDYPRSFVPLSSSCVDHVEMAPSDVQCAQLKPTNFYGEPSNVLLRQTNLLRSPPQDQSSELMAVEPKKSIFISHLTLHTRNEDVISHILQKVQVKMDRNRLSCLRITPKSIANPYYAAFKIDVPEEFFSLIISPQLWPPNAIIREFTDNKGMKRNFRHRETIQ